MSIWFHSCGSYTSGLDTSIQDQRQLDVVVRDVVSIIVLGFGSYGVVLLLKEEESGREWAVKMTSADYHDNEMHIACQLETLSPVTQVFIHTYGWLMSRGAPLAWRDMLPSHDQSGKELPWHVLESQRVLVLFMEYSRLRMRVSEPIGNPCWSYMVDLNDRAKKAALFLLIHGLMEARKQLGFSHNDLHSGQIVLVARNPKNPLRVGSYCVTHCSHIPKILDFGMSVTNATPVRVHTGNDPRARLWATQDEEAEVFRDTDNVISDDIWQKHLTYWTNPISTMLP